MWGRKTILAAIILTELLPLTAHASYDLILTGVSDYNIPVLYSNKNILVDSNAFVCYKDVTFNNCTVDVLGSCKIVSKLILNTSVINVFGNLKVLPGCRINETGPSSIIATGDSTHTGTLTIEGEPRNLININSDNVAGGDAALIIIRSGCSLNSTLKFVYFYGGWRNVLIQNVSINDAVSNCAFFGAVYGIYQEGPDQFTYIRFCLFHDNTMSIFADLSAINYNSPEIWIDNVQIDNAGKVGSFGVGINIPDYDYGYIFFKMTNSIITNSYCGWGVANGHYDEYSDYGYLSNIAYYGNVLNNNWPGDANCLETRPIYLTQTPFEGTAEWPFFIKQSGPVAEVNLGYSLAQNSPQQLLTSLFANSSPRSDKGMGFGVPILRAEDIKGDLDGNCIVNICDFAIFAADWKTVKGVNTIHFPDSNGYSIADFDKDGIVDYFDLATFCANWITYTKEGDLDADTLVDMIDFSKLAMDWMTIKGIDTIHFPDANGYSISDFDKNGRVNTWDLVVFCANWLSTIPVPGIPLIVSDSQDSLTVNALNISGLEVTYYDFFLDGKYIASRDPNYNPALVIDKAKYSAGVHYLEAIIRAQDVNDINHVNHYLSEVKSVRFNSPLHDLSFVESFDPSRYYVIQGKLDAGYTVNLAIKDIEGASVWSGSYSGDFIAVVNPAVFSKISYDLIYTYQLSLPSLFNSFAESIINPLGVSVGGGGCPVIALDGPPDYSTKGLVIAMLELGMTEGTDQYNTGSAEWWFLKKGKPCFWGNNEGSTPLRNCHSGQCPLCCKNDAKG